MCGIAGFIIERADDASAEHLRLMMAAVRHRGPDDSGHWQEHGAYLGHRRLSIIELTRAGHQPMLSHDGRYALVYNGEIYNHLELRRLLDEEHATPWRGQSDSETLLEALARWGLPRTLQLLNGMFAFALWDRQTRGLSLARDPFGEKPLFFASQTRRFAFASEFRAMEAVPWIDTTPDPACLAAYLRRWYVPTPLSPSRGVAKLPAGSFLLWRQGAPPAIEQYWSIRDAKTAARRAGPLNPGDAVDEVDKLLDDAVSKRLMSDVPLGALLSGGVDSTLVVAMMQRHSPVPVKTFSIGFNERSHDEAHFARAVASYLGTDHTERYVAQDEALRVAAALGHLYDEPFADSSQIPVAIVCALARQRVTVALTGEGGDELFGGYERYQLAPRLWRTVERVPFRNSIARLLECTPDAVLDAVAPLAAALIPKGLASDGLAMKLRRLAPMIRASGFSAFYDALIGTDLAPCDWLLQKDASLLPGPMVPGADSPLDHMMLTDTNDLLTDDLLVKVDRASMAVGLEGRMPMLDRRLAELAWRIPRETLHHQGEAKWPLKALLRRYVPGELVDRPKMGFGVPLTTWLRGGFRNWAEDLLSDSRIRRQGLFDPAIVGEAWTDFLRGRRRTSTEIWSLLMLQSWLDARGA